MTRGRKLLIATFIVYCTVMLWLLFVRPLPGHPLPYLQQLQRRLNLTPLHTIRQYLGLLRHSNPEFVRQAVVNLVGNVAMFVPLGVLLPLTFPRLSGWLRCLALAALLICAVEAAQLFSLRGTCDIDDLILNLAGIALGRLLLPVFNKRIKD